MEGSSVINHPIIHLTVPTVRPRQDDNKTTETWRERYRVHPAADIFPMLSLEELAVLAEDIAARGLLEVPVLWQDMQSGIEYLVDGRNRLTALEQSGRLDRVIFRRVTSVEYP